MRGFYSIVFYLCFAWSYTCSIAYIFSVTHPTPPPPPISFEYTGLCVCSQIINTNILPTIQEKMSEWRSENWEVSFTSVIPNEKELDEVKKQREKWKGTRQMTKWTAELLRTSLSLQTRQALLSLAIFIDVHRKAGLFSFRTNPSQIKISMYCLLTALRSNLSVAYFIKLCFLYFRPTSLKHC